MSDQSTPEPPNSKHFAYGWFYPYCFGEVGSGVVLAKCTNADERTIISAVAEVAWRKEMVEVLERGTYDSIEERKATYTKWSAARNNADAWREWGGR